MKRMVVLGSLLTSVFGAQAQEVGSALSHDAAAIASVVKKDCCALKHANQVRVTREGTTLNFEMDVPKGIEIVLLGLGAPISLTSCFAHDEATFGKCHGECFDARALVIVGSPKKDAAPSDEAAIAFVRVITVPASADYKTLKLDGDETSVRFSIDTATKSGDDNEGDVQVQDEDEEEEAPASEVVDAQPVSDDTAADTSEPVEDSEEDE